MPLQQQPRLNITKDYSNKHITYATNTLEDIYECKFQNWIIFKYWVGAIASSVTENHTF